MRWAGAHLSRAGAFVVRASSWTRATSASAASRLVNPADWDASPGFLVGFFIPRSCR